eukprot:gene628-2062_t
MNKAIHSRLRASAATRPSVSRAWSSTPRVGQPILSTQSLVSPNQVAPLEASSERRARVVLAASKGFGAPAKKKNQLDGSAPCPCCSGAKYEACCESFHKGTAVPDTPEQLLRARFSAYAMKNPEYIADTTCPGADSYTKDRSSYLKDVKRTQKGMDNSDLTIVKTEEGADGNESYITFYYKFVNTSMREKDALLQLEKSRFSRKSASTGWLYMDSTFPDEKEVATAPGGKLLTGSPKKEEEEKGLLSGLKKSLGLGGSFLK